MKKIFFLANFILILNFSNQMQVFGQNQEIKTDLPTIIPPSPDVAALMKFVEIPVSNYTGVPSISVPLYSYSLPSNKVKINVELSYHTQSTKLDELASFVGLGWSLNGGGSISRTIRDIPDEQFQPYKYGIYTQNPLKSELNYYKALDLIETNNLINYSAAINIVNDSSPDLVKEFLWESNNKGKYDTQHDLWQYNFLGYTGKFIIEKQNNGILEVKLLDNSTLKIINHYNTSGSNFIPIGFTIYDDIGYKYVFDVIEVTKSTVFVETTQHNDLMSSSFNNSNFNSAFHLSKIYDNNDKLLVQYDYLDSGLEHINNSKCLYSYPTSGELWNEITNFIDVLGLSNSSINAFYKPKMICSSNSYTYQARKLSKINFVGVGKIEFNYQKGRLDEDYFNRENVLILKGILIKDSKNLVINNFELQHVYKDALKKKLFLDKLIQKKQNESFDLYSFSYKSGRYIQNPTADYWGFLTSIPDLNLVIGDYREVDRDLVSMFALEKMILPTKGCVVFNYESNTYSAIKNNLLTTFNDNPYNFDDVNVNVNFTSITNNLQNFFTINEISNVKLSKVINFETNSWWFSIYKDFKSPSTLVGGLNSESDQDLILNDLEPGNYLVEFKINDLLPPSTIYNAKISASYKKRRVVDYKSFLYGGGFRIASIANYNSDFSASLGLDNPIPISQKIYNYNFFNDYKISSGSLISEKPVFSYSTSQFVPETSVSHQDGSGYLTLVAHNVGYNMYSNVNVESCNKTQGADIGYKNVSVSIKNKGRTEYTYTSSLDYPDVKNSLDKLFLPPESYDYKRGLLELEENYDNSDSILSSTAYSYSFEDYIKLSGLYVFGTYDDGNNNCPVFSFISDYDFYKYLKSTNCPTSYSYCGFGKPFENFKSDLNLGYHPLIERFGWAKLTNKTSKNYFYPNGSSTPNITKIDETYTYNSLNKQISESTVSNSNGVTLKTKYFYHTGNSIHSQNRIAEIESIETYRGTELLSKSKVNYGSNWQNNVSFLPQTIVTAKGANTFENRLEYKQYDEFSNPLEVLQENGVPITYIWGYNKTQPIAKIENATYSQVQSYVANLQTLSNGTDENALITALNALRSNLPNALVTTYTYKPLIGVSTVTDPKGLTTTYSYDEFNRLIQVKDHQGNILTENKYNYRPQ